MNTLIFYDINESLANSVIYFDNKKFRKLVSELGEDLTDIIKDEYDEFHEIIQNFWSSWVFIYLSFSLVNDLIDSLGWDGHIDCE